LVAPAVITWIPCFDAHVQQRGEPCRSYATATVTSLRGVCLPDAGYDRYVGHTGEVNHSGHWLITLYSTAFTLSLACDLLVWAELLVYPQCVSETFRG
jgi:hypothetical protein